MEKVNQVLKSRTTRALAVGAGAILGLSATACSEGVNRTEREVTVCDKERVFDSETSEYRVYTSDAEDAHTYRVVDTLVIGGTRMNSADFYGQLREGVTYNVVSSGYRQGWLSTFPNIIEVERLPEVEQHPEWCM